MKLKVVFQKSKNLKKFNDKKCFFKNIVLYNIIITKLFTKENIFKNGNTF